MIIAQWKFPSHLEFISVKFAYFGSQDAPGCETQVKTKNFNKTTTVLWTPNLPCYAFVRYIMFFSRCVEGCLEQLRWEPFLIETAIGKGFTNIKLICYSKALILCTSENSVE